MKIIHIETKTTKKTKKRKSRASNGWVSDESEESDRPVLPKGIMKVCICFLTGFSIFRLNFIQPDITFFGEKLNDEFDRLFFADRDEVDLLLIIGTSLKVSPVSEILSQYI